MRAFRTCQNKKQSVSVSVQFQVLEILEENQRYHIFILLETISISIKIKHLGCVKPIPSQNLLYLTLGIQSPFENGNGT